MENPAFLILTWLFQLFLGGGFSWLAWLNVALIVLLLWLANQAGWPRAKQALLWFVPAFLVIVVALLWAGYWYGSEPRGPSWRGAVMLALLATQIPYFVWLIARLEGARPLMSLIAAYHVWMSFWAMLVGGIALGSRGL